VEKVPFAVVEETGFREALDCDILFSCVDRPWGRHVLNYIAYAYLIPVVDGGIEIKTHQNGRLRNAAWRIHTVFPGKRCLECIGQYGSSYVNVERQGELDNPTYIADLPHDHTLKRNENIFSFSAHLGSSLILQMLRIALKPAGMADSGEETYYFPTASLESERGNTCCENCYFTGVAGRGDAEGLPITGSYPPAEAARARQKSSKPSGWWAKLSNILK
jgi:hypothetical protein